MKYKKKYIVVGAYKMKDNTINYSFYYMNECFLNTFATTYSLNEAKEILSELNEEIKGSFRESGEYIKEHKK